ncbi:MAG TPA: hypothetical protein VNA22_02400 [Pyrinomonadaceae bacterium]|nr:hypothetical protein [Pyrinomonadaceae bacterium]
MFEQELYDREVSSVRTQPGDLFYNYEIRNWNFSPRLYKILAGSAVFNVVALVVIGSTGLLTARGCDSPFVGRVCQVLDTVYVGSLIFGAETEYSDDDYVKTELEDADVTFVDVTGVTPPLAYPEGYFQLANPEQQFANMTDTLAPGYLAPGIPANPIIGDSGLINTPPISAPSNPNAIMGDLPTGSPLGIPGDNPTITKPRRGRRGGRVNDATTADSNTNTNTDTNTNTNTNTAKPTVAEAKEEAKEDENGVPRRRRPLTDKANETLAKVDAGAVQLDRRFRVVITGTLGLAEDGKTIILKNPKAEPADKNFPADAALTKLAQEWVVAVGDSGWYVYLGVLDDKKGVGRKITIMIEQNDEKFVANVRSELPTPERANTMATALRNFMTIGALKAKPDDLAFLKASQTSTDANFVLINFEMPKGQVQEVIQRKLAEFKEKEPKPNGNAEVRPERNTAVK